MSSVTYTANIECLNQVRLTSELTHGYVDNLPIFNRVARSPEFDFYNNYGLNIPQMFSSGLLFNDQYIENGLIKPKTLNGPSFILDTIINGNLSIISSDNLNVNHFNAYIFKRTRGLLGIYNTYQVNQVVINNISYYQVGLSGPIFISTIKHSIRTYSPTDLTTIVTNVQTYMSDLDNFSDLCEYIPTTNIDVLITTILQTEYFPLYNKIAVLVKNVDNSYTQIAANKQTIDLYNGIISLDLTGINLNNITGFYIFYGVLPAYSPVIKSEVVEAYNSLSFQKVIISNKTSSTLDHISLNTNTVNLIKDTQNTNTATVIVENNSYEYLFIEPDHDIQINNKTVLSGTESILPGKYNELDLKLARSIYGTNVTIMHLDIGIYDRYNHVKKYIDTITINIS
jgi:hypothetical protein